MIFGRKKDFDMLCWVKKYPHAFDGREDEFTREYIKNVRSLGKKDCNIVISWSRRLARQQYPNYKFSRIF
jgi:hypothetical protein